MTPALAATLARVAGAMALAERRWWVIGSAAAVLHGAQTAARDVDVLIDRADAEPVLAALGLPVTAGVPDARFRSAVFARWTGAPLAVEFMAGFAVRHDGAWHPVEPATRTWIGGVAVPARGELIALFERMGRPQDLTRAALLRA